MDGSQTLIEPVPIVENRVFVSNPTMAIETEISTPPDYATGNALPPIKEGIDLLHLFFEQFNRVIPLFDEPSFMHLTQRYYKEKHQSAPIWWAPVNVGLSLAYRLRAVERENPKEEKKAFHHLSNALESVNTVSLSDPELLSIQAMLGIVIFLQRTPNPYPASTLVAAAVRLSQSLGLHRQSKRHDVDVEQRKNTFWIAYQLDKDCSMRLHQRSAQNDDDIDVELLSENLQNGIGIILALDGSPFSFFRHIVELSTIPGQMYSRLHSVQALKTPGELSDDAQALYQSLGNWTRSIPTAFRPEKMIMTLPKSALLHTVILSLSYFKCLSQLHSVALQMHQVDTSGHKNLRYPLSATLSSGNYVVAARAALHLVILLPKGDYAYTW